MLSLLRYCKYKFLFLLNVLQDDCACDSVVVSEVLKTNFLTLHLKVHKGKMRDIRYIYITFFASTLVSAYCTIFCDAVFFSQVWIF